jgi:hypothetical protein
MVEKTEFDSAHKLALSVCMSALRRLVSVPVVRRRSCYSKTELAAWLFCLSRYARQESSSEQENPGPACFVLHSVGIADTQ